MRTCPKCAKPTPFPTGNCEDCLADDLAEQRWGRPPPEQAARCVICCQPLPTDPPRPGRMTCSARCRTIRQVRQQKAKRDTAREARPCIQCQRWFVPPDVRRRTCSAKCKAAVLRRWQTQYQRQYQKRYRQAKKQPKECVICGKSWLPADRRCLACSADCERERQRRVAKERYQRQVAEAHTAK